MTKMRPTKRSESQWHFCAILRGVADMAEQNVARFEVPENDLSVGALVEVGQSPGRPESDLHSLVPCQAAPGVLCIKGAFSVRKNKVSFAWRNNTVQ